jgi:hypothetical protein
MNLYTYTRTSSTTPYGNFNDLSANWRVILVGFTTMFPIVFSIDKGTKLMLAHKSSNVVLTGNAPMVTEMLKVLESLVL